VNQPWRVDDERQVTVPGNMGEGSETKRQLGRIVLQRRALPDDGFDPSAALGAQDRPTRPSPLEHDLRLLLLTMGERDDARHIDLRRVVIQLSVLEHVSAEFAREHQVLPLAANDERLLVAIADPSEQRTLVEISLASGRTVLACVPLDGSLREVIESAYAAALAGASIYRGPLVLGAIEETGLTPVGESLLSPTFDDPGDFKPEVLRMPREQGSSIAELPQSSDSEAKETLVPSRSDARRKVLVVDDSDDIRRLLVRVFREREYEVLESARGNDALEQIRERQPDVLVLDAMLPEIHGFDLCRRVKASRRYGHIPVVMLSAVYRGWRFAEDLKSSYGVDEFLEKPFRIGDVVAAVERALAGKSLLAEEPEEAEPASPGAQQLEQGLAAYAEGDIAGAIEQLKRGLELDPIGFRLHYHLGLLYGKQGNVFEAIQSLEGAADLKPRDFATLKNLAVLYQRAGFRLKAAEMWQRALGQAPDEDTRTSIRNHLVSLL
jgi:DNA-binding response OmpR family regulator